MTPAAQAALKALTPDEKQLFGFLLNSGSAKRPHSGDTLFHHLLGTYLLLKRQGADSELCTAGLFHSVYGTSLYREPPLVEREEVRKRIGERAERLAWLFSVLRRPQCWSVEGTVLPLAGGGVIEITADDRTDLLTIERANQTEKALRRRYKATKSAAAAG